jgi:hypothetical protein
MRTRREGVALLKDRLRATIERTSGREELRRRALDSLYALPEGDRVCHGTFTPVTSSWPMRGSTSWTGSTPLRGITWRTWPGRPAHPCVAPQSAAPDGDRALSEDIEGFERGYLACFDLAPEDEEILAVEAPGGGGPVMSVHPRRGGRPPGTDRGPVHGINGPCPAIIPRSRDWSAGQQRWARSFLRCEPRR